MSAATILVIEPDTAARSMLVEAFVQHTVIVAADAASALELANDHDIDLVITELLLRGHSGMEFLYEFRTYDDWQDIPVIVYSSLQLEDAVLRSRSWKQLGIAAYAYKPKTTLQELIAAAQKALERS